MGIFLDVLPASRKNYPGPIEQGHLHLQVIPVNELDYLVNPPPSDTWHSGLVGPDPKCLMHAMILMWDGDVFSSLARCCSPFLLCLYIFSHIYRTQQWFRQPFAWLEDPFSSGSRTSQKAWFYGFFDRPWP